MAVRAAPRLLSYWDGRNKVAIHLCSASLNNIFIKIGVKNPTIVKIPYNRDLLSGLPDSVRRQTCSPRNMGGMGLRALLEDRRIKPCPAELPAVTTMMPIDEFVEHIGKTNPAAKAGFDLLHGDIEEREEEAVRAATCYLRLRGEPATIEEITSFYKKAQPPTVYYIYLLRMRFYNHLSSELVTLYKLGQTKDLQRRLLEHTRPAVILDVIAVFLSEEGDERLHAALKEYHVTGVGMFRHQRRGSREVYEPSLEFIWVLVRIAKEHGLTSASPDYTTEIFDADVDEVDEPVKDD